MTLKSGARLGPYEIVSALGAGGMGEVYRATDTSLKRQVAIKVLPASVAADPERLARFQREAEVLAALNHPNIAHIHGLEKSDRTIALVMELVEGPTLADRIAQGSVPPDEVLPIAKQIAEALEAAHEQGIIHRDLKPANIKVRPDGTVKVLDFGLAKALDQATSPNVNVTRSPTITSPAMLTGVGVILGTAAYMSPEQARGKAVDKRADIWAFGVIVFEMLTGERLFAGDTISDTLASVLKTDPPWHALTATVPSGLGRLLQRCLRKDPKRRLQAIGEARVQIEDLLTGTSEETGETALRVGASRERINWTLVAVGASLVAALAVPAVLNVRRVAPDIPLTRLDLVTPPTMDPFSFAISPDGRQIVFVAAADGGSKLWLRPLDQTTAQSLAGTDRARAPFWAPDSRAIGFFADSALKRIDLTGGPPQVLADTSIPLGGTWNRDGVIVFIGAAGLTQVAAAGGPATPVAQLNRGDRWPQFLPDGRHFLFYSAGNQGVYRGSLDGGPPTRVVAAESAAMYAPSGCLLMVSQGTLVARPFDAARGVVSGDPVPLAPGVSSEVGTFRGAFAVSASGVLAYRTGTAARRQLVWVDRAGAALGVLLPPEDTGLSSADLAPDASRVAVFRNVQGAPAMWIIEVDRKIASRFTIGSDFTASPLWSPDGSRLVFRSPRNGKDDLFEKPSNGASEERPFLITSQDKAPLSWSTDGRFLLYAVQEPKAQSDLLALSMMTDDRKPIPIATTSFDEIQGQFSPDGRWVAFASNETGRYEVYIQAFPITGGKWPASAGGGIYPRWRRDGRELFYVAPDNQMMAVPIPVTGDGRTITPGPPVALFPTRLTSGNTGNAGYSARAQYAVAPDGRFLLNVSADDAAPSPITIVQNWTAVLRK